MKIVAPDYPPVIAGQVGVAVLERDTKARVIRPRREFCRLENVIAFPNKVASDDIEQYQATLNRLLTRQVRAAYLREPTGSRPSRQGCRKNHAVHA